MQRAQDFHSPGPLAEILSFFFPLGFLQSLSKSPAGCGGHQTSQKPVRAASARAPVQTWRQPDSSPHRGGSQQVSCGAGSALPGLRLEHFPRQKQVRCLHTQSMNRQRNKRSDKECIPPSFKKGQVLGQPFSPWAGQAPSAG